MSEQLVSPTTPEHLSLRQAVGWRRHHSSNGSRRRISTFLVAVASLIPLQVIFFLGTGEAWSLVAVALNPLAAYVGLRGWAYHRAALLLAAVAVAFVGNAMPFWSA
ncbi:MAG TPA: hypothetical protein VFT70_16975 [Nocardioides sp.]|nr:hypothetical protein [Nocardioides sp.]